VNNSIIIDTIFETMKISIRLFVILASISLFVPAVINGQNVGIGTTTPLEKLHVNGNVRIDSLGSSGDGLIITNNDGKLNTLTFSGNSDQVLRGDGTFSEIQTVNEITQNFITFTTIPGVTKYIYDGPNFKIYYTGNILYFESLASLSYYAYGVSGNAYTEGLSVTPEVIEINNGLEAVDIKVYNYNPAFYLKYEGIQRAGNAICGIITIHE